VDHDHRPQGDRNRRRVSRSISRGVEPAHFEKFFASLALGDGAAISMFDQNGTLLARHPHSDALIGRSFKGGALLELVRPPQTDHGTMRLKSPIDGEDRVGAFAA